MADEINKKISIEIDITDDGQQIVSQYKAAFDNLRSSVNNLSSPLSSLDKNISNLNDSLSKLNNQNKSLTDSGNKVETSVKGLTDNYISLNKIMVEGRKVLNELKTGFASFEVTATAGLSLLITFGPQLWNWISSLIKGKEAISHATLSLGVLNKALQSTDYSNAVQQVTQLKTNIDLARKGFLDKKTVLEQYNKTLGKTMGTTNDLNQAEKNLINKGDDYIKMTLLKAEAQLAFQNAAQKAIEIEQEKHKSDDDELSWWDKVTTSFETSLFFHGDAVKNKAKQNRQEAIDDLNNQKNTYTKIAGDFETQAARISKALHFTDTNDGSEQNSFRPKKHPKAHQSDQQTSKSAPPGGFPVHDAQADDPNIIPADVQEANDAYQEKQAQKIKEQALKTTKDIIDGSNALKTANHAKEEQERQERDKKRVDEAKKVAEQLATDALNVLQDGIKQQADAKVAALEKDKTAELNNTALTSTQKAAITQKYQQEEKQVKAKAFKEEQELNIAKAIMNGALAVTKVTAQDGVLAALEIGVIVAETSAQIAKIASQKSPAYASGGLHYRSDGRGGVLPGYSRTDNTNAFLRSGEGIVVSEAMREPWARNLVSAINVGFGGRDFSTSATGRGFAVGGIFTDGGNANRYYNQPVNDNKNLANTIAYQMINNFPPVYVDVKDINNQQNILAQTINRVNL
jgi:hypothetical protein